MQGELDLCSRGRGSGGAECLEVWRLELERREVFLGVPSNDGSVRCRHLHAVGPPILGEVGGNLKVEVFILSRDGVGDVGVGDTGGGDTGDGEGVVGMRGG